MERIEPAKIRTRKKVSLLAARANTPVILRWLAIAALIATVLGIGIGFYRERNKKDFRLIPGLAELSTDVTGVVTGYERRETEGNVMKYFIKADKATTYTDNHQELENVYLEAYDDKGEKFDRISANKAVYIPAADKNFDAYFTGKVDVLSRDNLNFKSEQVAYNRQTDTVTSEVLVEFSRENLSGKSMGAIAKIKEKHLELLKDVEFNSAPVAANDPNQADAKVQTAKMTAGHAVYDQATNQATLEGSVFISVVPLRGTQNFSQPTDLRAEKATAFFENQEIKKIDLTNNVEIDAKPSDIDSRSMKVRGNTATTLFDKELSRIEVNENVQIETTSGANQKPTNIRAQNAVYEKPLDRFDLKNNVEIVTVADEKPTVIHGNEAIYEQTNGKIAVTGNAEITQGADYLKGDRIDAQLFPNKKLQTGFARGNAYLKQTAHDRTTEVKANELNAFFGDNQLMQRADANGAAYVTISPAQTQNYSKTTISAPQALHLAFRQTGVESVLSEIKTDGRTSIVMNPAMGNPDSSLRKITADTVRTTLSDNGTDISKAEAVGNAELYVEPTRRAPEKYKTTVTAPRFDCDFYAGNNAKTCAGAVKGKAILEPTMPAPNRGTRTLTADKLIADFNQNTNDVERFDAIDNAKFTELDRSGIAGRITYAGADETVRLRGGEPTVWDSRSRARAAEIDWDAKNQKSYLRGKVSTTYYTQKQTNGATPFGKSNAPVFVTAGEAQFDHQTQVGVYTGNARAWQDDNYVRADKLILNEPAKRMDGEGKVQSLLYDARRKTADRETTQTVFAASDKIAYTEENRQLRYEGNADIRQGNDRLTAGVADVFLDEKNEMKQTVVQNNVIITQPNRRATGNWAQYTTSDETIVLRGAPATVADAENGSSQGSQMTISMRDNRMTNQGAAKPNQPGRTRSVYKVKP